ncbi:MAG: hypothetical protein ACRDOH_19740 [Streptosporangiaceae bacterium]
MKAIVFWPRTGSASGSRYRYRAGNWLRMARGGRVIAADSTTSNPNRSRERGSSQAHAHRAFMPFLAASRCWRSKVCFG